MFEVNLKPVNYGPESLRRTQVVLFLIQYHTALADTCTLCVKRLRIDGSHNPASAEMFTLALQHLTYAFYLSDKITENSPILTP